MPKAKTQPSLQDDLPDLIRLFEGLELARAREERAQTHASKRVRCAMCAQTFGEHDRRAFFVPNKSIKDCPRCAKCGRHLAVMQPRGEDGEEEQFVMLSECNKPGCGGARCASTMTSPAPRVNALVKKWLPAVEELEGSLKKEIETLVGHHMVWQGWAEGVKGLGKMTLARIMGRCDINSLNTGAAMWAHAGLGLNKDGKPQRKVKGQPINYDQRLQSYTCILGESLMRATDSYYEIYCKDKERWLKAGLTKGHAHNRAFRHMRKLCLSHLWEIWRKAEGLPARPPYAMEYLGHTSYISPESMCVPETPKIKKESKRRVVRMEEQPGVDR